MKLVLRDYIESLKEDQELDYLISELLLNMSILPLSRPQKGRQHGVDIAAVGHDPIDMQRKIFLVAVKSGDLDRKTWDTGTNAVRPTLNEIIDTYISTCIPPIYKSLPIKIIVSSNGVIDSNVNQDWTQFVTKQSVNGISFDYWGIDFLTLKVEEHLFNESILSSSIQHQLKKALVFLDVPDYDLSNFYELIDKVFESLDSSKKKINRKNLMLFRTVNVCLHMIFQRGKEIEDLRPVIKASERVLLVTWGIISKHELLNRDYLLEYRKLLITKEQIDTAYFKKIEPHLYVHEGLAIGGNVNHLEYSLNTYEQIGILSNIGNYYLNSTDIFVRIKSDEGDKMAEEHFDIAKYISENLVRLIDNNPASFNPTLDEHVIELHSAITLLLITDKKVAIVNWINGILNYLSQNIKINKVGPQFVTNYEELFEYHFNGKRQEMNSSMLLTFLAEWAMILQEKPIYEKINRLIKKFFPEINLQLWFPEKNTEEIFYFKNAMRTTGSSKHSITLYENHLEYQAEMMEEKNMFKADKEFTCVTYGFNIIAYWAFRHYRTYPFPNFWRNFLSSPFCFNDQEDKLLPKNTKTDSIKETSNQSGGRDDVEN